MNRYWKVKCADGNEWREGEKKWSEVSLDAVGLSLHVDGREYKLPDNAGEYFQAKTASAPLAGGDVTILSRYIGFRRGNIEYYLRVAESDSSCLLEVKEIDQ